LDGGNSAIFIDIAGVFFSSSGGPKLAFVSKLLGYYHSPARA
jgi:hypothetical protein